VVYRLEGRAIWTVYNEKVLAGLGRDLAKTGRLSPDGVAQALEALKRYRAVLDAMPGAQIFTAATAAVRDAEDGAAFLRQVDREIGLKLRLLSGEEEARYSALGVLAGLPHAEGVVGDLGGASLELTRLDASGARDAVSLPLGPFAVAGGAAVLNPEQVKAWVAHAIEPHARRFRTPVLHAVGGAWRNFALLHMRMSGYPLEIVHQYEIGRREAISAARLISHQSQESLSRAPGLSRKRVDTLPYAAVLLEALIEQLGLEKISLSAYGLREGLLFDSMNAKLRARDPLIEGCSVLASQQGGDDSFGPALAAWVAPVFAALPPAFGDREPLLTAAACRLADIGARLHPDHRADLVFAQVLRSPIAGQTHAERAFLAAAAYSRYSAPFNPLEGEIISRLLSPERLARARALGAAIRLGCDLSGRTAHLLSRARLAVEGATLRLTVDRDCADLLLGEQTLKRANSLAQRLGRKLAVA
jgi:exopolyphosphatase/guanosine-5'-triphosphate,3'-diphosphate pyrophosphatase